MLGIAYNDATEVHGVAGDIKSCCDLKNAEKLQIYSCGLQALGKYLQLLCVK